MQSAWINAGIYRFSKKIFDAIKKTQLSRRNEFEITESISYLVKEGRVGCIKWKKEITDIGSKEDLEKAEKLISEKE